MTTATLEPKAEVTNQTSKSTMKALVYRASGKGPESLHGKTNRIPPFSTAPPHFGDVGEVEVVLIVFRVQSTDSCGMRNAPAGLRTMQRW